LINKSQGEKMRKLIFATVFVVIVLAAFAVMTVSAQAPGPGTWNVGFTMQNSNPVTATVQINFQQADGTSAGTWSGQIGPYKSQFLYSGSISTLNPNTESAATISSDQPLTVIANLGSTSPSTQAAYSGITDSEAAAVLYAPGVYKNYYYNTSNIRVQNVGSSKTCVKVSYTANGATTPTTTEVYNVLAGSARTFLQGTNASLPNNFIGNAKIESVDSGTTGCAADTVAGQKLVGIVNISVAPNGASLYYQEGSYNLITSGSSAAYVPVLSNNYYGNVSALTVLNRRGTAQWVRVTYGNNEWVKEKQVAANSTQLWYTPNEGPSVGWFGGGKVECLDAQNGNVITDCEIAATVNQSNVGSGAFASYNGFSSGSPTANLPIVNRKYSPAYGGFTTSVTCQNISSNITTTVSLALSSGTVPAATNVGPNSKAFWYLNKADYVGVAMGFNGSATATTSPSAPIVCIGQQNGETPPTPGDWLTTYDGVNQ
jgi:hypothetical protein